jgi:hypothetical protein
MLGGLHELPSYRLRAPEGNENTSLAEYMQIMVDGFIDESRQLTDRSDFALGHAEGLAEQVSFTEDGEPMKAGLFVSRTGRELHIVVCMAYENSLEKCEKAMKALLFRGHPESVEVEPPVRVADFVGKQLRFPDECQVLKPGRVKCSNGTSFSWFTDLDEMEEVRKRVPQLLSNRWDEVGAWYVAKNDNQTPAIREMA